MRRCLIFMPRSKCPEHTRKKAMRSRWLASILACILNTKPENAVSVGVTVRRVASRASGAGAHSSSASRISRTPKLLIAEPKNTGVCLPLRKAARSNGFEAPSTSSTSDFNCSISNGNFAARTGLLMPFTISNSFVTRSSPGVNSMISSRNK